VRVLPREHPHDVALSTSFGFGGHDVSLVLTR
jgi:3-oxoacyl-(acyl-carrier-protein) synthase